MVNALDCRTENDLIVGEIWTWRVQGHAPEGVGFDALRPAAFREISASFFDRVQRFN